MFNKFCLIQVYGNCSLIFSYSGLIYDTVIELRVNSEGHSGYNSYMSNGDKIDAIKVMYKRVY